MKSDTGLRIGKVVLFLVSHLWVGVLVAVCVGIGWYEGRLWTVLTLRGHVAPPAATGSAPGAAVEEEYTCSMHPGVRNVGPGKCPICFMDLVPVPTGGGEGNERTLVLDEATLALIRLETSRVERRAVAPAVRLVGKLGVDETRVADLVAWVAGRLDRLFLDTTGVEVAAGDPVASLYSGALIAAQEELLQALAAARSVGEDDLLRETVESTAAAARTRMAQWGLDAAEITEIEERGAPIEHLTIRAPQGGVVLERMVEQGAYVKEGTKIARIGDLSRLWVNLAAYESDLKWLHLGDEVEFTTEAYPGEVFAGALTFLSPLLDPRTRTVEVRAEVDNADGRLRPGMFVRASVRAGEAAREAAEASLVIPWSAPLVTGNRSVVFVELAAGGGYESRDVVLGARAGEWVVVKSGLEEGELVVSHGAFKLDSELQIRGKPSLMSPPEEVEEEGLGGPKVEPLAEELVPAPFRASIDELWRAYLALHAGLSGDDLDGANAAVESMVAAREAIDPGGLADEARAAWTAQAVPLDAALASLSATKELGTLREAFEPASHAMQVIVGTFGVSTGEVYEVYCPMAFDFRGARWLQDDPGILNPYFGDEMLRCGEVLGRLLPAEAEDGE